jgi:hypothetical protein
MPSLPSLQSEESDHPSPVEIKAVSPAVASEHVSISSGESSRSADSDSADDGSDQGDHTPIKEVTGNSSGSGSGSERTSPRSLVTSMWALSIHDPADGYMYAESEEQREAGGEQGGVGVLTEEALARHNELSATRQHF